MGGARTMQQELEELREDDQILMCLSADLLEDLQRERAKRSGT